MRDARSVKLEAAYKIRAERRYAESIAIFKEFADGGDPYAQVQLGDMFDRGLGVERNLDEAQKWLARAASSGGGYNRFRFARFLEEHGDKKEAFRIVDGLAKRDYAPAVYRLARYLQTGTGTEQDISGYKQNVLSAAKLGHVYALRALSVLEMKGQMGVRRIPIGVVRFVANLFYVAKLAAKNPDSPNFVN